MSDPAAELSSLSSALGELTGRITTLAGDLAGEGRNEVSSALFEVERSLVAGQRRLEKLVRL